MKRHHGEYLQFYVYRNFFAGEIWWVRWWEKTGGVIVGRIGQRGARQGEYKDKEAALRSMNGWARLIEEGAWSPTL